MTPDDSSFRSLESQISNAERWKATLERAMKGIVSIKYTVLRTFDRAMPGSFIASGFIVDRNRGIILSNRHVVNVGPTSSTALFNRYEEVSLVPIYFDPVHDFGFFKYDPRKIKFAEVEEIELYPQGAKVGLEIKVCGSDDGEHRSILGSTLARLDRAPPHNNDFNTFYFQAASGTSGGSSGSPVLDIFGRAVALHAAGSTVSASSYYLPLDRVVRALKLLQEEKPVPRGTLQTEFIHTSYDELMKLGLPEEIEKKCRQRNEDGTGLLMIKGVLPEGPGSLAGLEVGDILLDGYHPVFGRRYFDTFQALWEVIDESVGDVISLTVFRGTKLKNVSITIQNLHSIIPNTFLEVAEAVIHPLSYQVARLSNLPCKGLFVAASGMFNWWNTVPPFIITQIDGKELDCLDTLIECLRSTPNGKKVSYKFRQVGGWEEELCLFDMDHQFFGMTFFKRAGETWERTVILPKPTNAPVNLKLTLDIGTEASWQEKLRANLVVIKCRLPYSIQVWSCSAHAYDRDLIAERHIMASEF